MLKKLSEKIGFTQTEIKVILFLIIIFLLGFGYKTIFNIETKAAYKKFDYSKEDSLFNLGKPDKPKSNFSQTTKELKDKKVDYKQEVLDFNKTNFNKKVKKTALAKKSININTAGIKELKLLPGIGEKTAQKIIVLRKKRGGFKKLNELLDVKGIGNFKFSKVKKYIFIEE